VAGVTDPQLKEQLYTLAFTIVRADESVTGGERIYLAQLAHRMGLDPAAVARLEAEASARIDAAARGLKKKERTACPRRPSGTWPSAASRSVRSRSRTS